ncbi:ATP-binding protein [Kaistia dalseonensis]|uniref:histidine kinase n=1 Tax=Kaistia dalseonensis TaxID=410840 RepID=A0ABU0H5B8_9HYPH|nr:PAS domain-containing sensor histidine kinase [Kaistia dalseonensis]MCX5494928.1 ATP-binding protein [Kaistia dalseonensis]MDQ0437509.1 signal transduction histidine kinase [Kaistia dalseonensis]
MPAAAAEAVLFDANRIVTVSALVGVLGFSLLSVIALLRSRNRAEHDNLALRLHLADLQARADRAEALVNADDQRLVAWSAPEEPPLVVGRLPKLCGAPEDRAAFLAFGTWLVPSAASQLDAALERLRGQGEPFSLALETSSGNFVEAIGRTTGGRAVARFRDLSGDRLALAELDSRHRRLTADVQAMRELLEAAPTPAWIRDRDGGLDWINPAFARAVESQNADEAKARGLDLLDTAGRDAIRQDHMRAAVVARRLPAVVAGARRIFDVIDVASESGSAGIAIDATELETVQAQMKRLIEFHARTLDQLATAVAVFGPDRRLRSYNAAFRDLFGLEATFLDTMPDESAVLERMRAARRLPEQADFKSWRNELLSAYQALDAQEHWWHLPDGQTLRVLANPHPQGGITWIYENVTEKLDLESRYNSLIRVQGETLDHLAEGVAVFGSDGRLRLDNPAFARIWKLDQKFLSARPHINEIERACRRLHDRPDAWARFTALVSGLGEGRAPTRGRLERLDGRVVDYATIPLPNGQTMVTFVDVTDTVKVERVLTERNEALEAADGLKNAFIQHVSYELRSPLTNIIGFTQLLSDVTIGPLNEKQREYAGYILSSSGSLLAIVNDILDLATVDAGIITLELGEVNVAETIAAATEGVRDRLQEAKLRLDTRISADLGTLIADEKRVRQILYNLLSNAVSFSTQGGRIELRATRRGDMIEFTVADQGPGIPPEFIAVVFDRFESRPTGSARGGAGLGLAIVKSFVELHGGSVSIDSEEGRGTIVKVSLPISPTTLAEAAE